MSYDVTLMEQDAKGDEYEVFWKNYTSNMSYAWREAGIPIHEWDDGEHLASDVVDSVRTGIDKIKADIDHYRKGEPDNGWGSVDGVLSAFLEPMLDALERFPNARILVSR